MSRNLRKVQGVEDLYRDMDTGVVINLNKEEIRASRERRKMLKKKNEEHENLKATVESLQDDIKDIKSLLSQLIEKK